MPDACGRPQRAASAQSPPSGAGAWAIVDWPAGAVVAGDQLARLRQPTEPGSFLKIATLVAAFATGVASPDTRVPCEGEATVKDQIVRCSHPRLRHPLRPAEALAVSCNIWFATVGARLSRARLDGVLAALGLPPTQSGAPMPLVATGLRASPSSPMAWVEALSRLLRQPSAVPLSRGARATLVEGLRGAALYGTANAFSERGLDVLAKPAPQLSPPEAPSASSSPHGRPVRQTGHWSWSHRRSPARTPPTWQQPSSPDPCARRNRARFPRREAPSARDAPRRHSAAGRRLCRRGVRARRLRRASAGRRSRGSKPACGARSARGGGADVCRQQSRETSTRRLRRVHAHALPGAAHALRGCARCGVGDRRPGSARQRRTRVGVLHGVVRRTHRAPVGSLARRRRSELPALEIGSGLWGRASMGRRDPRAGSRTNAHGCRLSRSRSCGTSRWMAAVHQGAWRVCTSTG